LLGCEARFVTHPTLEGQPKHLHLASLMTSIDATSVSQSIYHHLSMLTSHNLWQLNRWHQSWHHLQQMDAQTVVSNVVMLGTVGNAVATALRWKDALTLLLWTLLEIFESRIVWVECQRCTTVEKYVHSDRGVDGRNFLVCSRNLPSSQY